MIVQPIVTYWRHLLWRRMTEEMKLGLCQEVHELMKKFWGEAHPTSATRVGSVTSLSQVARNEWLSSNSTAFYQLSPRNLCLGPPELSPDSHNHEP